MKTFLMSHPEERFSALMKKQLQGRANWLCLDLLDFLDNYELEETLNTKSNICIQGPEGSIDLDHDSILLRVFGCPEDYKAKFSPAERPYIEFEILSYLESLRFHSNVVSSLGNVPIFSHHETLIEQWMNVNRLDKELKTPIHFFPLSQRQTLDGDDWITVEPSNLHSWKPNQNLECTTKKPRQLLAMRRPEGKAVMTIATSKVTYFRESDLPQKVQDKISLFSKKLMNKNNSWIKEFLYFVTESGEITFAFSCPRLSNHFTDEEITQLLVPLLEDY